jgi:hypothetical protein
MNNYKKQVKELRAALVKIQNEGDVHSNSIATSALNGMLTSTEALQKGGVFLAGSKKGSDALRYLILINPNFKCLDDVNYLDLENKRSGIPRGADLFTYSDFKYVSSYEDFITMLEVWAKTR